MSEDKVTTKYHDELMQDWQELMSKKNEELLEVKIALTAKSERVAELEGEVKRWFQYVDPFDMYPEDREEYNKLIKIERDE